VGSKGKDKMMKKFLTPQEAAHYLGMPENELVELSNKNIVPMYRIGGIYSRYKVDDLENYRKRNITSSSRHRVNNFADILKDFFYFNDFYIFSIVSISIILYFIFK
jgi:hypothetical protein